LSARVLQIKTSDFCLVDYQALGALPLLRLQLRIAARATPLRLPAANKGNALRGAFGVAFRRLVCIPQCQRAAACPLGHRCPYKVIFEPSPPPDAERLRKSQDTPRPFVFRPPLDHRMVYAPGEDFEFGLILIGRALYYLPHFVLSFRDVARAGLGIGRAPCELSEVRALPPPVPTASLAGSRFASGNAPVAECVYSVEDQLFHTPEVQPLADWVAARVYALGHGAPAIDGEGAGNGPRTTDQGPRTRTVQFLTPTSLKFEGRAGVQPDFHHLFKRVRDRLNALCTFYGAGPIEADFKGLGERAEKVRTTASKLNWIERSRVSSKTHQRHELSGFVGSCTYQGRLEEFLPWLAAGEMIGAGRHTAWGNGRYLLS
jgi:hypothetical protein